MRTGPLAAAAWVVAATLTLGVSWSAVQVVRSAVAPEDLATALPPPDETGSVTSRPSASAPPRSAEPTGTRTPRPSGDAGQQITFTGTGGTVVVQCVDGRPQMISVIPRIGFRVERDDDGVEAKFRSARHRTELKFSCAGLVPQVSKEEKDEGGGGDDSGRGGGDD